MSDFILCAALAFLAGFVLGAYSWEGTPQKALRLREPGHQADRKYDGDQK